MIRHTATRPTSTSFAFVVGAAVLASPFPYPTKVESYQVQQISGTYSDITENLSRQFGQGDYKRQLDSIFSSFAKRQVRLGTEFEAAIFSDLDSLYEA